MRLQRSITCREGRSVFDPFHKITKIRNHLRRTTGKIDNRDVSSGEPVENAIDSLSRHDFPPLWSGIHMAVGAGEIAKLTQVDLKNFWMSATKKDRMLGKFLRKPIHLYGFFALRFDHLGAKANRPTYF